MDARLLRLGLVLLVVVLIAEGWHVLWGIIRPVHLLDGVSSGIGFFLIVLFLVGFMARAHEWFTSRGPEVARRRAVEARRERVAVRRPAEGVPVDQGDDADPEDPDPPLPWGEGR